jgi:hypothetical protein
VLDRAVRAILCAIKLVACVGKVEESLERSVRWPLFFSLSFLCINTILVVEARQRGGLVVCYRLFLIVRAAAGLHCNLFRGWEGRRRRGREGRWARR